MHFLNHPPRFLFFTGKGGVGKTSLACASAVKLADAGKRVLLVSTDPASNVGQVFGMQIGNEIKPVTAVPGLRALEIDPPAAAAGYRTRILEGLRKSLSAEELRGVEEQLSGACTTEIAAFDEFTGLLVDAGLDDSFDHILFDTAPTGHTLRLLQLPGAWNEFLQAGRGDASCLGPLAGLERQRKQYADAVAALADPTRSRLVLIARAQPSSLREVAHTHTELGALGLNQQYLVLNGVLAEEEAAVDPLAAAIRRREQAALADLPEPLRTLPLDELPLQAFNLVGVDALRQLLDPTASSLPSAPIEPPLQAPPLGHLIDEIAAAGHGLVMLMGKGGVGKTTLAAAVAVALARRGLPVHLTTSDPAAHLSETLAGSLDHLRVSRIDPHSATEAYRAQVMATKGARLDEAGRALLAEDLRSPCTEEIAVFQAFSRAIRESSRQFVVMDTAPTGHTLLLLDATGAYHREVARQMVDSHLRFTTPMMQLQNPQQTKVLIVTLAETTPVLEALGLQADLRRAGIEPWAWVVNSSLAATTCHSPLLQRRAQQERAQIEQVAHTHAQRYAVVPLLAEEPVGVERLLALSASGEGVPG